MLNCKFYWTENLHFVNSYLGRILVKMSGKSEIAGYKFIFQDDLKWNYPIPIYFLESHIEVQMIIDFLSNFNFASKNLKSGQNVGG